MDVMYSVFENLKIFVYILMLNVWDVQGNFILKKNSNKKNMSE